VTSNVTFAAPFQNLGFDEANTNNMIPENPIVGYVSDLLPGWQLYKGTNLQNTLFLNTEFDTPYASLFDHSEHAYSSDFPPEGPYAIVFWGTRLGSMPFSLVQKGDIPQNAVFVKWRTRDYPFLLNVNGEHIRDLFPIGIPWNAPEEQTFDISKFAGQNVELKLTTYPPGITPGDYHFLDSIQFMTAPPTMAITQTATNIVLSWPASTTGYVLQSTDTLSSPNGWQTVSMTPVVVGTNQIVITNLVGTSRFYRMTGSAH
jgi:hypothetical protein